MPMDSLPGIWNYITSLAAAALLVAAAACDIASYRIPNVIPLVLLVLFPVYVITSPVAVMWERHVLVACAVLAAGFLLYAGKFAGAGDVKLASAAGLWAGPERIWLMLFCMAVAGGLLALAAAFAAYRRHRAEGSGLSAVAKAPIPYGVAIAAGGLCALVSSLRPFSPFLGE